MSSPCYLGLLGQRQTFRFCIDKLRPQTCVSCVIFSHNGLQTDHLPYEAVDAGGRGGCVLKSHVKVKKIIIDAVTFLRHVHY